MDTTGVVARTNATGLQASEGVTLWKDLDAFTQGYIEAMFFTEEREHVDGEDVEESGSIPHNSCFGMIEAESLARIVAECKKFQEENEEALIQYERHWPRDHAGHDFWLTRNGHGTGFWDRGLPDDVADPLDLASCKIGESYVDSGDDGVIYVR